MAEIQVVNRCAECGAETTNSPNVFNETTQTGDVFCDTHLAALKRDEKASENFARQFEPWE